jgi:hypothetical protein
VAPRGHRGRGCGANGLTRFHGLDRAARGLRRGDGTTADGPADATRPPPAGGDGSGVPLLLAGLTAQAASASSLDDVVRLMSEFQFLRSSDPGAPPHPAVAAAAAALLAGAHECEAPLRGAGAGGEQAVARGSKSPRRAVQPPGAQAAKSEWQGRGGLPAGWGGGVREGGGRGRWRATRRRARARTPKAPP